MADHTPGPWSVVDKKMAALLIVGEDQTKPIARMQKGIHRSSEAHEANAEFIVRACNVHEELLETLEEQVASFWGDWPEYERESFRRRYWPDHPTARAEAAIAKAKGGADV